MSRILIPVLWLLVAGCIGEVPPAPQDESVQVLQSSELPFDKSGKGAVDVQIHAIVPRAGETPAQAIQRELGVAPAGSLWEFVAPLNQGEGSQNTPERPGLGSRCTAPDGRMGSCEMTDGCAAGQSLPEVCAQGFVCCLPADAQPQPPGQDQGMSACADTCRYANDGVCDDGGTNSQYSECPLGTDCTDCGPRANVQPPQMPNHPEQPPTNPNHGLCENTHCGLFRCKHTFEQGCD